MTTSNKKSAEQTIAAPPKPPTTPTPPKPDNKAEAPNFDLASAISKVVPDKETKQAQKPKAEDITNEVLEQADAAAEVASKPKAAPHSKTHSVKATHAYAGPRDGSTYVPATPGRAISRRDILPRRYLVLMARPEGADENVCRRVNTDRGPTVGGFAQYTANSTGVNLIYTDGAYRVAFSNGGKIELAPDFFRQEVYDLCGGDEYREMAESQLGPDFTIGLPVGKPRAKKEKAAA